MSLLSIFLEIEGGVCVVGRGGGRGVGSKNCVILASHYYHYFWKKRAKQGGAGLGVGRGAID